MPVPISRRDLLARLLKAAAGGAAADLLLAAAPPETPKRLQLPPLEAADERVSEPAIPLRQDQRTGFALVGVGHLALEQILPAFGQSRRAKLTAVVSGDPEKARDVVARYAAPGAQIYDYPSFDRIRDNPDVQAVYIALPNSLHAEYTVRAAQAGKHVLCEKPMAIDVRQCDQMIQACRTANRLLMIAYRMQYEPYNRAAMRLAREGKLGALSVFSAENGQDIGDPTQWRAKRALSGGGCLVDVGIYCLNAARYLSQEEPIEVSGMRYSTPGDPRFKEVEETFAFLLRFPSGLVASCSSGYGEHRAQRYRLAGSDGWLEMDPAFPYQGLRLRLGHKSLLSGAEELAEQHWDERNQFARELDHFAQCMAENRQPRTPGEEGRQDVRIMEALYTAARDERTQKLDPVHDPVHAKDAFRGPALTDA